MTMRTIGVSANGRVVGESRTNRKMTAAQVDELRRLRAEHGWSFKKLGEIFGVSDQNAWQIVRGKTWNVEVVATKQQVTEQDTLRVTQLMAQGFGLVRVSRALGVTRLSAHRLISKIRHAQNSGSQ